MKKTSKFFAMLIVIAMLTSSFVTLISNVTFAAMENVTVVFTADSDSKLELSEDGKTLTYTCEDNTKFSISLQEDKTTDLVLRRETTEVEPGHYSDSYIIENVSSNENVFIKCENIDLSKLSIMHDGVSIGMFDGYSLSLNEIDDINHYQFRIEELIQNSGEEPGNEPGEGQNLGRTFMVDFGTAEWTVDETKVTAAIWGMEINNGPVEIDEKELIKLDEFNPETMRIVVRASDGFTAHLQIITDNNETSLESSDATGFPEGELTFAVEPKPQEQNPGQSDPINPTPEPGNDVPQSGGEEAIEFDAEIEGTNINLWINELPVMSDADGTIMHEFKGTIPEAGTTNPEETNIISVCTLFGEKDVKEYIINGVSYTKEDALGMGEERIDFEVPGATKYTIRVIVDEESEVSRTIIWANPNYVNDGAWSEEDMEEMQLVNGYGYVAAVYNEDDELINPDEYRAEKWYVNENGAGVGEDGFGWIHIKPGYKVIFEFIPEYGYQLTDIKINGQELGLSGLMNNFEFIMPDTNIHFDAEFSKTEDVVKVNSKNVSSGTVNLAENSLDAGSAQLTVNDIELDAEKIKGFEEAAGDYKISNYLDIDLYQVFYKGKQDSEDVWSNKIDELEKEATISIKLEEGVTAEDIIIVHNIHDGDEYEVIKIESYDEETNTITFKTSSFSNYAIATKIAEEDVEEEKYTLETEDYVLTFTDEAGHEFVAEIVDLWSLTDEEVASLDISSEEYEKDKKTITENVKKYGTVLNLYNITVADDEHVHSEGVTFKIKMTEEMNQYNSFKLVNLNEEDFSVEDIVELKIEGDYLVGSLPHLSVYALVGENVETENAESEPVTNDTTANNVTTNNTTANNVTTNNVNSSNPTTGDNITIFITLFVLAILGIFITVKINKNHKARKH